MSELLRYYSCEPALLHYCNVATTGPLLFIYAVWVSELLLYCSVVLKLVQHWSMATGPLIHYCVWHYWIKVGKVRHCSCFTAVWCQSRLITPVFWELFTLLFRLRTNHTSHQKPNPSRETVLLSLWLFCSFCIRACESLLRRVTAAEKYVKSASQVCNYTIYVLNQGVFNV